MVAAALLYAAQIRDQRLYTEEFGNFQSYCRVKWEYGRDYVDRLISAAQVFTQLPTNCRQKPEREGQVRPLVGLRAQEAPPTVSPTQQPKRVSKAQQHRLIDAAIGELLVLAGQTQLAKVLIIKIGALHAQIQKLVAQ